MILHLECDKPAEINYSRGNLKINVALLIKSYHNKREIDYNKLYRGNFDSNKAVFNVLFAGGHDWLKIPRYNDFQLYPR